MACRLPSLTLRKGLPCLRQPFFFVFSRFQKQRFGSFLAAVSHGLGTTLYFFLFNGFQKRRFGIFPAAVSQWLGHKTCWGSAFSHARPKHLFLEFGLVACRLPSLTLRKGLPCLRQPFFFVFSRFQKRRFGIFLFSAFFVGSKSNKPLACHMKTATMALFYHKGL